jgi:hypothetical protein
MAKSRTWIVADRGAHRSRGIAPSTRAVRNLGLLIGFAITLANPPTTWAAPASAKDALLQDDKFSKSAMFVGPVESKNPFGGTFRMWRLRTWIDKSNLQTTHQLYVDVSYTGNWRFYERASDDHARDLPLSKISQNLGSCSSVLGCDHSETVGIDLSDGQLRAAATTGMEVKLWAHSGDTLILPVTVAQIQAQMAPVMTYQAAYVAAAIAMKGSMITTALSPPAEPNAAVLGVRFTDTKPDFAKAVGAGDTNCVLVVKVEPDSVAKRAGLSVGDCFAQYGGQDVNTQADLIGAVRATMQGQAIEAVVMRGGRQVPLHLQY